MNSDVVVNGTIANVIVGHVLLFIEPLWATFVYMGDMIIAFGGVLTCALSGK